MLEGEGSQLHTSYLFSLIYVGKVMVGGCWERGTKMGVFSEEQGGWQVWSKAR